MALTARSQIRIWSIAAAVLLDVPHLQWVVVVGLGLFGVAFAVNSSVHSYLVLAYAGSEKAAEDVGFYYAANALGPFLGGLAISAGYGWQSTGPVGAGLALGGLAILGVSVLVERGAKPSL